MKKGNLNWDSESMCVGEEKFVDCLKQASHYKFLGITGNMKQDDSLVLEIVRKAYIQRLSLIWSSPLSDYNKMVVTNQLAIACAYLFNDNPGLADHGITKARQRIKKGDFGEYG